MKGLMLFILCLSFSLFSIDAYAAKRGSKSRSNVYVSKKYKGHNCPKPRKIINAAYF